MRNGQRERERERESEREKRERERERIENINKVGERETLCRRRKSWRVTPGTRYQ